MEELKGLKGDMEELKHSLERLLLERLPRGENVSHETHDEEKRNMPRDWRDSNFGLKMNHIPKIDMRKFDRKDPVTWILQMEQFFDLHEVKYTQKVCISSVYLEPNQFVWY